MIELTSTQLRLQLDPEGGGTVLSLSAGEQPILRAAIPGSDDPRDRAAFPLVPFSGRIEQGCFTIANRLVQLAKNMPPEPHAIHGQGWQSSWIITQQSPARAQLQLNYPGNDWPWPYRAMQTFEVQGHQLKVELALTNQSAEPMPAGLGWHPYFPRGDARLIAPVQAFWENSVDTISLAPTRPAWLTELASGQSAADQQGTTLDDNNKKQQEIDGMRVDSLDLDNAFTATNEPVRITWPTANTTVTMRSSANLGHLIIYTPAGEPYFCVEPVSHAPNCLNGSLPPEMTGKRLLDPGTTMSAWVILEVQ